MYYYLKLNSMEKNEIILGMSAIMALMIVACYFKIRQYRKEKKQYQDRVYEVSKTLRLSQQDGLIAIAAIEHVLKHLPQRQLRELKDHFSERIKEFDFSENKVTRAKVDWNKRLIEDTNQLSDKTQKKQMLILAHKAICAVMFNKK